MAAAVPSGVSSRGGSSRRRAEHLLPLPRTDAPTPTIRASSSRRSEALEGAAQHGDDPKGMGKQVIPAADATGGRGGHYHRSPSYDYSSAAPLARHHPALPPVSSRGGRNGRTTHGGDDASSSVALRKDEEQERLLTRDILLKPHSIQQSHGGDDASSSVTLRPEQGSGNVESVGSSESRYQNVEEMGPSDLREKIRITLKNPKPPSIPQPGCIFNREHLGQYPSSGKGTRAGTSRTQSAAGTDNKAGHGDPHPPPFLKCQVCRRRTAFYRLKCCHQVTCELCGCECNPDDVEDAERSQVAKREKLPKVKLEGSNLFLRRPFKFPSDLMLCKVKGDGKVVQYTFASIEDLMDSSNRSIPVKVYRFKMNGTWTVSNEML